ncbi:WD repeat-containing protein 91-like [Mercenaria mercenaria]|uniref:WD repeat-containing protein 91-like n=1 Tax=Mercenaria mercenaria TaxID=6596 RepID=UPI00234F23B5|nr:WD repeat-containing protein 91-like [Mercenaria mercenaria]
MFKDHKMATAAGRVDEFVKDYLIYRGLSTTLKTLEIELRNEKEKGFRVDKIVEQLQLYVSTYDLANLRDYWNFLNNRLFSRLEQRYMSSVRKLEVGLLKYYLVNAAQNNKQEKILEFFERMTEILQSQMEFKEWFAFPFVRNPRDNSHFATYFTVQWQDTFFLSLHNFLSVILQAMPGPVLLNFEAEHRQIKELQEENEKLKQQIKSLGENPDLASKTMNRENYLADRSHMDLVYDFSSLGEDTAIPETTTKSPKKFPFTSSPLHLGKKNEKPSPLIKKKDDQIKMSMMGTKDSKSGKGSKLLPVITRQKKPVKINKAQNQEPAVTGHVTDAVANQNTAEVSSANHKMKKLEEARLKRKELLEGSSDKTKSKEEKKPIEGKQESSVVYNRSVSESAADVAAMKSSPRGTRRTVSKSVLETKSSMYSSVSKPSDTMSGTSGSSDSMETVSPLATATIATMLGTSVPNKAEEMQTFPPAPAVTEAEQPVTVSTEPKTLETIHEKPFLLLSQDEYSEHRASVSYARFSNSGQYVASVDVDGVVKVWTWSPQANTAATVMSKSAFLSLEWASKSDRWLLLGNRSGNIRLFDVKEMKSFYEATADTSYPRIVTLCSNPAAPVFVCSATSGHARSGSTSSDGGHDNRNGKLTVWDLKTMKSDKTLPLESGPVCVNSCSFNHNGQLLITGGADGVIRLFDVSQQRCISHWQAHDGDIRNVLYSADYNSCYSLGNDGKMTEWSMHRTGQKLRDLPIHQGAVPNFSLLDAGASTKEVPVGKLLALDSDGHYLLSCNDTSSEIYRLIRDDPGLLYMMDLRGHRSSLITTVDWSPNIDTKICLTGYLDGKIIVSTLLSQ